MVQLDLFQRSRHGVPVGDSGRHMFENVRREIIRQHDAVGAEYGGALDGVFEFADVTRPEIILQIIDTGGVEPQLGQVQFLAETRDEKPRQGKDVLAPLSRRRSPSIALARRSAANARCGPVH